VLVIGSGISGLVTAYELKRAGYKVTVIEANKEIGGRTKTIHIANPGSSPIAVNAGAAWIHDHKSSPTKKYIEIFNIPTIPNNGQVGFLDHMYFTDGTEVQQTEQEQALEIISILQQKLEEKRDLSYDRAFGRVIAEIFHENPSLRSKLHNKRLHLLTEWLLEGISEYNACSLDNLSVNRNDLEFGRLDGTEDLMVRTYGDLISALSSRLQGDIIIGDPVTKIRFDPTPQSRVPVQVFTKSGKQLSVDKVVVTVSLGVLKAKKIEFQPELPTEKLRAINNMGFGLMNKVIFLFEEPFWDPQCHSFGCISETQKYNYWLNMLPVCGYPVIVGFFCADFAQARVSWPKERIISDAYELLKLCFGKSELPKLISSEVTDWANDPWVLGSYSYLDFKSSEEDHRALSKPINDKIYFAGEHTSVEFTGEVSAAVLSAQHVVDLIKSSPNSFITSSL